MWSWSDADGRADAFIERGEIDGEEFCREIVGVGATPPDETEGQTPAAGAAVAGAGGGEAR